MGADLTLHRHETASLGARGCRLAGVGSEHARLLRLVLLSYTRWPGRPGQNPWPSNKTLASRTRLDERQIERAMAALRDADLVATRTGRRTGARRPVGRLIDMRLHAPCKALAPGGFDVGNLWTLARSLRARPAALVTAMVGAFMLASDAAGCPLEEWSELGCSMSDWRRFIGHRDNASWTKRVRELERLGLLRREGRTVLVSPPRAWFSLAVEHAETKIAGRISKPRSPAPEQVVVVADQLPEGRMLRVEPAPDADLLQPTGTGPSLEQLPWNRGPP